MGRVAQAVPRLALALAAALALATVAAGAAWSVPLAETHARRNAFLLDALRREAGPTLLTDVAPGQTWQLARADGAQMVCAARGARDARDGRQAGGGRGGTQNRASAATVRQAIDDVLQALRGACLQIEKGYWTYEFCADHVSQFRGNSRSAADQVWSLGTSDGQPAALTTVADAAGESEQLFYFASKGFSGGAACDKTGASREARAVFFCCPELGEHWQAEDPRMAAGRLLKLESIEEHRVCNYTLTLCSPRLCEAGLEPRGVQDAWTALRPLSGLCFQKATGWWTFQLCVEKAVHQVHLQEATDEEGKRRLEVGAEFSLGVFAAEPLEESASWPSERLAPLRRDAAARSLLFLDERPLSPAAVQVYAGGSPCDIADGSERVTVVRFVCDQATAELNALLSVQELASCVYQITFHTTLLCAHPLFRPAQRDPTRLACAALPPPPPPPPP